MRTAFITPGADAIVVDIFRRKASGYIHDQTVRLQNTGGSIVDYVDDNYLRVYLSLPTESLNYRIIDMPFADKDKILATLPYALEGLIRGPYDSYVADCIVLERQSGDCLVLERQPASVEKFQILVVYIDKAVLGNTLSELKAIGIEPKIVTSLELRYKVGELSVDALYDTIELSEESRIAMCRQELQAPLINLARGELAYTKDIIKTLRGIKIALLIMALIILLVGAATAYKIHLVNRRVETLKSYMINSYKKMFVEDTRVVDPLYQLKAKVKKIRQERGFFDSISPLQGLSVLSAINAQNIVLIEVEMSSERMTLKGEAVRISDVDAYKDKLAGQLSEVRVMETKTATDNKVIFSIQARTSNEPQPKGQEQGQGQ
ncbi:MAG: hypothetical protein HQL03_07050 [Nitrospirae bacterium]|nr:hypothetical protein [Nitrospirota bacterium]MBF0591070.1 hypothetical protein [Nitrospirota bacterium]